MFDNHSVSRRTVTRTAAWSAPAVAVVAAAPAFAASPIVYQTITRNLHFRVFVKLNGDPPVIVGDAPPYATPPGAINQEVWDVVAETTIPVSVPPNTSLSAPPLTTTVTTSVTAADTLRTFAVTSVNGSASPTYVISGSVVNPGPRVAVLSVPDIDTPATGGIVTVAAGNAQPETSTTAGSITQNIGKFSSIINCTPAVPIFKMGLAGALEPLGQDTSFGEILVG